MKRRKPSTQDAMKNMIREIQRIFPFGASDAYICRDNCIGCSKKLLVFLEEEINFWQNQLEKGITPSLGDLCQLSRTTHKIGLALERNAIPLKDKLEA